MSGVGGNTFVLTSSDLSVAQPLPVAAELVAIYGNLGTAGSTQTTFQVNKNGSAVSGALATVAASATKGNKVLTNPYVGVNVITPAVNDVAALATFVPGDTVSLTTTLGTSAANPGVALHFKVK
ncbi:hypothetical protein [Streptomyces sp. NPDC002088]|uniref:hypothetical protein n=1 Tax=Streptomyces sp. NPDC002088 TaxID=3154665 RepID=UPI0033343ECC